MLNPFIICCQRVVKLFGILNCHKKLKSQINRLKLEIKTINIQNTRRHVLSFEAFFSMSVVNHVCLVFTSELWFMTFRLARSFVRSYCISFHYFASPLENNWWNKPICSNRHPLFCSNKKVRIILKKLGFYDIELDVYKCKINLLKISH